METLLARRQLRWIGHMLKMDDERLPKQTLYGELSYGDRDAGGQKKHHIDYIKILFFRKIELLPGSLDTLSTQ